MRKSIITMILGIVFTLAVVSTSSAQLPLPPSKAFLISCYAGEVLIYEIIVVGWLLNTSDKRTIIKVDEQFHPVDVFPEDEIYLSSNCIIRRWRQSPDELFPQP